ncbi:hypothetical protein BU25DRAFT_480616 [Macroventuria anomochaeta]|uniref:Uncharacterized protein n=1 Tax=Macroventuria anomochaeta TaxID=301207 RepID=A0ACB6RN08_9PLEO|nr:uncharacterized protein BU25DRAFT_480616 [Macroventuria anomochaeta]KAF2622327.1 hypothetical protein BU25DRAFT_480616 [Macroventuria anomochaeta]
MNIDADSERLIQFRPISLSTFTSFTAFATGPLVWWAVNSIERWRPHFHACPSFEPMCDPFDIGSFIQLKSA